MLIMNFVEIHVTGFMTNSISSCTESVVTANALLQFARYATKMKPFESTQVNFCYM